jgi:hypothetical protein
VTRIRVLIGPAAAAVVLAALAGCGGGPETGTVAGKVTLDGTAVAGGTVSFLTSSSGVPVTVPINPDGTYQAEGVPAGEAVVTVAGPGGSAAGEVIKKGASNKKKGPPPEPEGLVPKRYADPATSGLGTTVTEAGTRYDIRLTK